MIKKSELEARIRKLEATMEAIRALVFVRLESDTAISGKNRRITATEFCNQRSISDTTLWRWVKAGKIQWVNINGRNYLTEDSIREFDERTAAGEFAKTSGAAGKHAKK